ncbi:hypothetical protein AB4K20DRAFT_1852636 [Rhizopus microsporus]
MRAIFTISTAIAFFTAAVFAADNADFDPVDFSAEDIATTLDSSFATFRWKGDSTMAQESFNLVAEEPTRIQVTDFKNLGDVFEVFDNGISLGTTSEVEEIAGEEVFAATPEEALEDERFSKGVFTLEKGEHKITIKATGPYEAGGKHWGKKNKGWFEHDSYKGHDNHKEHKDLELSPPYYDLDYSHTVTVTKTVWVEGTIPSKAGDPITPVTPPTKDDDDKDLKIHDHPAFHDRDHDKDRLHFH